MSSVISSVITSLTSPAAVSAFLSTGLISLVPNLLLFFFPTFFATTTAGGAAGVVWQWGQCLAAGGLLGDVFLHTLPHVIMEGGGDHRDHGGEKQYSESTSEYENPTDQQPRRHHEKTTDAGMWILLGFTVFFTMDVLLRMTEDTLRNRRHRSKGHGHDHSHHDDDDDAATRNGDGHDAAKATAQNASDDDEEAAKSWSLIVLNLTADALHNFTDGLAIGASYAAAASTSGVGNDAVINPGGVATLSVLLHEVPHELGDYCTLVAGGYTPWQAVRTQFLTAVAAFCGTAVALVVTSSSSEDDETSSSSSQPLMLLTAGGFLYLAGTTILPHVLSSRQHDATVTRRPPWHRLGHLVAFAVGVAFMRAVALLEEAEHHHDDDGNGQYRDSEL